MGADGVLIPYINNADEARQAVSCARYPTAGTRSVYFPQRSMNKAGLLGYAGAANDNVIVALQVETADCIRNMDEIAAVPGVDILFLGQNDLCMSLGLYEKYEFPHMYTSPELQAATDKLAAAARRNNVILGLFLFGTARAGEFLEKEGKNVIHLEIGEPDFPTPAHVVEAGKRALDEGWTKYGPTPGFPELREAIAAYISRTRGVKAGAENVCVVPGGKPIMFFTM